ncbi:MAG TPA: sugar kinase, partial [Planctomycetaceae bacterium]|nr:sugar kinase [Planctomycetaceae bacterium]
MELKSDCRFALLVPTSVGVRITPLEHQPVHVSSRYVMQATSAETNVATLVASLGLPAKVLTATVKGSPIGRFILEQMRGRGLTIEAKQVEQGGPWGYRHQFNIADMGYGVRGPRVWNDRAGEVGRTIEAADFDLERIFGREGVRIVHMSGLFAALSERTSGFCVRLADTAKRHGTRISFDLNYRASFWAGREKELRDSFTEIATLADVLVGNEEDFQLCLGLPGPEAGGKGLSGKIERFKEMILAAAGRFPNVQVFATTLREVRSANQHLWGAIMFAAGQWHVIEPRPIEVLDRIGGGDAFVAGLLYGILKGWPAEKWIQFGWAAGALVVTLLTDY